MSQMTSFQASLMDSDAKYLQELLLKKLTDGQKYQIKLTVSTLLLGLREVQISWAVDDTVDSIYDVVFPGLRTSSSQ